MRRRRLLAALLAAALVLASGALVLTSARARDDVDLHAAVLYYDPDAALAPLPQKAEPAPAAEAFDPSEWEDADMAVPEDAETAAALLYYGAAGDAWRDAYDGLCQSNLMGLTAEAVEVTGALRLDDFDCVYPDAGILSAPNAQAVLTALTDYVRRGGALFVTNDFIGALPDELLGIADTRRFTLDAAALKYPAVRRNLEGLQEVFRNFAEAYALYTNYDSLRARDYGPAFTVSTATPLVTQGGAALAAVNVYGEGRVLLTTGVLPNSQSVSGYSMTRRTESEGTFALTTATCNQLFRSEFASFLLKERLGYSLERVFGAYGRPAAAWQLHYEEITGIAHNALETFTALCEENAMVPSFTIVRNSYKWYQRAETVTYLAGDGSLAFTPDVYENAYSSGTHIAEGDEWLVIGSLENTISYFSDGSYTSRAYPAVGDLNGDGRADLLCGSADGLFRLYAGAASEYGNYTVERAALLTGADGAPLSVGSYSAPVLCDWDGDGGLDLLSGSGDGNVYLFPGRGGLSFGARRTLLSGTGRAMSMPDAGDLDGDGRLELVVGGDDGALALYARSGAGLTETGRLTFSTLSGFLAPRICDLDGDGDADLLCGTRLGYLARVINGGGAFRHDGYLSGGYTGYKGSDRLKFGNNAVPCLYDLTGDGKTDLVVGALEYGMAYPIDSPYFPQRAALQSQLDYCRARGIYVGMHALSNYYTTYEQERAELALHRKALESYGVDLSNVGANQHTWYVSSQSPSTTYEAQADSGLLWNSGAMAAASRTAPQVAAENLLAQPFLLVRDGERSDFLIFNTTTFYYRAAQRALAVRSGLPQSFYYHCDFAYVAGNDNAWAVASFASLVEEAKLCFMGEDQLAACARAAYATEVSVTNSVLTRVKNRLGNVPDGEKQYELTLTPSFKAEVGDYAKSAGVKLEIGEKFLNLPVSTDAAVWYRDGFDLYIGLGAAAHVRFGRAETAERHLQRVNTPAEITVTDGVYELAFAEDGLQLAELESLTEPVVEGEGWRVRQTGNSYVIWKLGPADTLRVY